MPTDYKKLWEGLIDELDWLRNHDVKEIHPQLLTEYMRLMVDREKASNVEKPDQ